MSHQPILLPPTLLASISLILIQTNDNFRVMYNALFTDSMSNNTASKRDETNFIARSFTDDPSIPLQQIYVSSVVRSFGLLFTTV